MRPGGDEWRLDCDHLTGSFVWDFPVKADHEILYREDQGLGEDSTALFLRHWPTGRAERG